MTGAGDRVVDVINIFGLPVTLVSLTFSYLKGVVTLLFCLNLAQETSKTVRKWSD